MEICQWLRNVKNITKIDIVDLVNYIPEYEEWLKTNSPSPEWCSTGIKCDLCGNEWIAVHHVYTQKLECPKCGNMTIF